MNGRVKGIGLCRCDEVIWQTKGSSIDELAWRAVKFSVDGILNSKKDKWRNFDPFGCVFVGFDGSFELTMKMFDHTIGRGVVSCCTNACDT